MIITALKTCKKKKERFRIYIDGKFLCYTDTAGIEENNLKEGLSVSVEIVEKLKRRQIFSKALDYSRLLISYRKRSREEIAARLKKKGYSLFISEKVLKELERCGEADDMDFAISWIRSRRISRPKGEFAIRNELKEKGVADNIVEDAFEKVNRESPPDRVSLAIKSCGGMLESYRSLDRITAHRRLRSLLARRGFDFDTIREVEKKFFSE